MSAIEYIKRKYGLLKRPKDVERTVNVSTTPTKVLDVDGDRLFVIIVNLGPYHAYLAPTGAVSTTLGIKISAQGGNMTLDVDEDGDLVVREWYAVAETGTTTLYVLEIRGEHLG